jgi:diguanylate cyclase (GGDEF)-like protein
VGTKLLRLLHVLLMLFLCLVAQPVSAAPADGDLRLQKPCFLLGSPDADPADLIKGKGAFNCALDPRSAEADTVWVRYDLRNEGVGGSEGWVYDHTLIQTRDERVWIAYADGRIRESLTPKEQARRPVGGQTQRYAFAPEPGQVTALLARLDGLENRRGPVPRASLTSHERTLENKAGIQLGFGLLAGVLLGIFFYNFTLYFALRYRVIAAYCALIAANLFYGAVWSNLILWPFPWISTAFQFDLSVFSISLCFFATMVYINAFLEDGMTSPRLMKIMKVIVVTLVCSSIIRLFNPPIPWQIADRSDYLLYLAALGLLLANCVIAWRRGSIAVRFFALAWTAPLIVILIRILWGLGIVQIESAVLDASVFLAISLEGALSSIGLAWRLRQLQSERDAAEDRAQTMYELASVDPLTGLANRRAFKQAFEAEIASADTGTGFAVAFIDLDGFKAVNDDLGHVAGDTLLQTVAARLTRHCLPTDLVGRLGGDEFAVIFRAIAGEDDVSARSTALLASLCVPADVGQKKIPVSASLGYAICPKHGQTIADLMQAADAALYAAKKEGKARVKGSAPLSELIPIIPGPVALRS